MVRLVIVCASDSKRIVDRLKDDLAGKCETEIVLFTEVHMHIDSEQNGVKLVILTPMGCKEIQKIKREVLEKLFDHQSKVKILFSCQQSQLDSVDNYCGMNSDRYSSVARYSTAEYAKFHIDVIACVEQFDGTFVPLQPNRFIFKPHIVSVPTEVIIVMFEEENEQKSFQKVVVRHAEKELPATHIHTNVWAFQTEDLPSGDNRITVLCDGQDIGTEILKVCEVDLKKAINAISVAMETRPLTSLATLLQTTVEGVDEELAKLLISKPSSIFETLLHLRHNHGGGGKSLLEICRSHNLTESFRRINQEKELPKQHSESSSDDDTELKSPLSRNSSASVYRCPRDSGVGHSKERRMRVDQEWLIDQGGSLCLGTRDSGVGHSQGMENESGSGLVNRPGSIDPPTPMPRIGPKKTNHYDEPWHDDLLEKLENLPVDQTTNEARVERNGSHRQGFYLPSTNM